MPEGKPPQLNRCRNTNFYCHLTFRSSCSQIFYISLFIIGLLIIPLQNYSQVQIVRSVLGSAGGSATNGNISITQHIGETATITTLQRQSILRQGFLQPENIQIVPEPPEDCQLTIYNVITPNGDGTNDFLTIEGISLYPDHKVVVVDRWGNIVFEQRNYRQNWAGTNNGIPLSGGTYYVIVRTGTNQLVCRGSITILRK